MTAIHALYITIILIILLGIFIYKKPSLNFKIFIIIGILYILEYNFQIEEKFMNRRLWGLTEFLFWCYVIFGVITIIIRARFDKNLDMSAHGTASWADNNFLQRFLSKTGLFIGYNNDYVRINSKGHLLTVAPTRSGKGVSAIIPNLLTYEGSIICIDPKGENATITAKRRREINENVFIIDPWDIVKGEEKANINPIEFLSDNKDLAEDVAYIADALVYDPPGQVGEAHWNEEAKALISGFLMYIVKTYPNNKNLSKLRDLLTLDEESLKGLFKDMQESDYNLIKRCANRMLNKSDKEFSGVLSTAHRHTQFLDSNRIEESTNSSSFDITDLIKNPSSVFIVIPPDKIGAFNRWLRIILTNLIMGLTKAGERPNQDIMFFIDEFAAIGRFKIIETAMGLMAGYGMKFWLFLQDLSQLKSLYEQSYATFISNSSVFQIFGTNDYETAKYISDSIGQTTIMTTTINESGKLTEFNKNSYSTTSRNLLTPDEIMNLPDHVQIVFIEGKPILLAKLNYYADRFFSKFL